MKVLSTTFYFAMSLKSTERLTVKQKISVGFIYLDFSSLSAKTAVQISFVLFVARKIECFIKIDFLLISFPFVHLSTFSRKTTTRPVDLFTS